MAPALVEVHRPAARGGEGQPAVGRVYCGSACLQPGQPQHRIKLHSERGQQKLHLLRATSQANEAAHRVARHPDFSITQAMARVWREGQQKNVWIYRMLTTGSIEEKVSTAEGQGRSPCAELFHSSCDFVRCMHAVPENKLRWRRHLAHGRWLL